MTSSSLARGFALFTLTALGSLACTTGAPVDAPPAAIAAEPTEVSAPSADEPEPEPNEGAQEVPTEDAAVLAQADPIAAQDGPEAAVAEEIGRAHV